MSFISKFSKRLPWVFTSAGLILAGVFTFVYLSSRPLKVGPVKSAAAKTTVTVPPVAYAGLPKHIKIPAVGVDAAVEYVGLTPNGTLVAPEGPDNAAWYDAGPHPGQPGNAVIDGHYGWVGGVPAVFDNLFKLNPGDKIYIVDDKGVTITFAVRELNSFTETQIATKVFHSADDKAHLNLITCEGVWNATNQSYSNRLVVFADREI
jgi:sortase (surface protein transpeptidase)